MLIAKRTSVSSFGVLLLLAAASTAQDEPARPKVHGILANDFQAPISFEPNQGQADSQVKFVARGSGYNLFLTPSNALLSLGLNRASNALTMTKGDVVTMNVIGANPAPKISGTDELPGKSSYFLGSDPSHWHTNIPNFGRVQYENIYPGIDLVFHGTQGQLEYDFVLHPGASPSTILIEFTGTKDIRIDPKGELVLETEHGQICFHEPTAYQGERGSRHALPAHYRRAGKRQVGFTVEAYDTAKTLVIDPILTMERLRRRVGPAAENRGISVPHARAQGLNEVDPWRQGNRTSK